MPANDWLCNFSCTADLLVVSHIEERSSLHSPHLGSFRIYVQACNLETGNDSIAFLQLCDPRTDSSTIPINSYLKISPSLNSTILLYHQQAPAASLGHRIILLAIEVQNTPTNSGSSNPDNHILRIRDRRSRDLLNAHVLFAVPAKDPHGRAAGTVFVWRLAMCSGRFAVVFILFLTDK